MTDQTIFNTTYEKYQYKIYVLTKRNLEGDFDEEELKKRFEELEEEIHFSKELELLEKFQFYYSMGIKPFTTSILLVGYAEFFINKINSEFNHAFSNYVGWKDKYVL